MTGRSRAGIGTGRGARPDFPALRNGRMDSWVDGWMEGPDHRPQTQLAPPLQSSLLCVSRDLIESCLLLILKFSFCTTTCTDSPAHPRAHPFSATPVHCYRIQTRTSLRSLEQSKLLLPLQKPSFKKYLSIKHQPRSQFAVRIHGRHHVFRPRPLSTRPPVMTASHLERRTGIKRPRTLSSISLLPFVVKNPPSSASVSQGDDCPQSAEPVFITSK